MEQAKDLISQTLQRIYSQKSYQSYQHRDDPIRNKVAEVIVTLSLNYGHLFTSHHCKNEEMLEAIITVWVMDIGSYSSEKLDKAIERCTGIYTETINLPQFREVLKFGDRAAGRQREYDTQRLSKLETPSEKSGRMTRGKIALDKLRGSLVTGVFEDVK